MSTKDFNNRVQGALRAQGLSISSWSRKNRLKAKTVFSAIYGHRRSKLSARILAKLLREVTR